MTTVHDVSFEVREGEILGIAGVQGNGQRELVEALTGLRRVLGGKVTLTDHDITHAPPREITERGTGHVPEDRHKHGLVLSFPVRDNLVLCTYYQSPFARGFEIDDYAIGERAQKLVTEFDVRTPSINTTAGSLSGGNQQKVIVAREMDRPVKLLIVNQPTRGLDVGSIEFIHSRIVQARDQRTAVFLVSAELDEIMSLSDRIAVMYKGQILETLNAGDCHARTTGFADGGRERWRACLTSQTRSDRHPKWDWRAMVARWLDAMGMPAVAMFLGFVGGALIIWVTSGSLETVFTAYAGMINGAFFKTRGFSETLVAMTPYIFLGLGLAVGFKAGLFNIGVEGQFYIGAISAVWAGILFPGLPAFIHLPLVILAGAVGGAIWAGIPAILKDRTGAHEVITTMMMNYIAFRLPNIWSAVHCAI